MNPVEQQFFKEIEAKRWTATDKLRSSLDTVVYKHIVLGPVYDPAMCSDGFFVQSETFIDQHSGKATLIQKPISGALSMTDAMAETEA
jgi:type I restriction-modification system DNA methylase subunit